MVCLASMVMLMGRRKHCDGSNGNTDDHDGNGWHDAWRMDEGTSMLVRTVVLGSGERQGGLHSDYRTQPHEPVIE